MQARATRVLGTALETGDTIGWERRCSKHLSWEGQFDAKCLELIGAFWLVLPTENEVVHLRTALVARRRTRSAAALPGNCTRLADSLQQAISASNFPSSNPYWKIHLTAFDPSCTIILLTYTKCLSESHLPVKFSWFYLFFTDIFVSTVPKVDETGEVGK